MLSMTEPVETTWDGAGMPAENSLSSAPGLAEAIRDGDETAFNTFYDTYADRTYSYLLSIVPRDEALARDAFQETMLRVVRYIKPMTEEALWGWLTRVARSALYDQLRRSRRRTARENAYGEGQLPQTLPDGDKDGERILAALRSAVDDLNEEDRDLIEAFYFQRQPQAAIAEARHATRPAVQSRLGRIRARLRERMKELLARDA
jgi:RNA polymerase sigma-70 factor (ECF subfamily)